MAGASYDRYNAYVALPQIEAEVKKLSVNNTTNCPFPVGSVLLFNDETDPNGIWSATTWDRITSNKYLVSSGTGSGDKQSGATGGNSNKTIAVENLPSHSHEINAHTHPVTVTGTATSEDGGTHSHTGFSRTGYKMDGSGGALMPSGGGSATSTITDSTGSHSHTVNISVSGTTADGGSGNTGGTGSGTSLNVEPAYYSVAIWTRTA